MLNPNDVKVKMPCGGVIDWNRKDPHRDPTVICSLGCCHKMEEIIDAMANSKMPGRKALNVPFLYPIMLPLLAGVLLLSGDNGDTINILGHHWHFKNYHFFIWDWTIIEIGVIALMLFLLIRVLVCAKWKHD